MKITARKITALSLSASLAFLTACSGSNQEEESAPSVTSTGTEIKYEEFNTQITIREIMSTLIDPPADALWNSVRVVSDVNGITEFVPETDEEWAELRLAAISIIEGSNALMIPGRRVAPPDAEGEFPEYEFTPEEVAVRLAADIQSWVGFSQLLQSSALDMLDAIDMRDSDKLSDSGAFLDEACEACHANYWYREGI